MEKSRESRHGVMSGRVCRAGVGAEASPAVFEHSGTRMCLDGTCMVVVINAESLRGPVYVSDGPLLSPREKQIRPMAAVREPIHLFAVIKCVNLDSCL